MTGEEEKIVDIVKDGKWTHSVVQHQLSSLPCAGRALCSGADKVVYLTVCCTYCDITMVLLGFAPKTEQNNTEVIFRIYF